jgi:outer membrane protein insertion porin family
MFLGYSFQAVKITIGDLPQSTGIDFRQPIVSRFFLEDAGTRHESLITPSFVNNTVDNPWTPRSGRKLTLSLPIAGGPLGGTLDLLKPTAEAIFYFPHTRRTALGVRGQTGWVIPFGDTANIDPQTGRNRLPFYERFQLGGETQVRGFDIRSIGPLNAARLPVADKFLLANVEYYFDIAGPLRGVLFFDAGQAFGEGTSISLRGFNTSTGAELRFIMPVLNVPFRLIYAVNPNNKAPDARVLPKSGFKFAVGTTF